MAKSVEQSEPQFDWELFGMIVRKTRQRMGYKKAEVFCESVYRRARVNISPVTYYRIERAEQEPTAVQLFGICMALFGEPFPQKVFNACASEEWRSIESSHLYADTQLFTPGDYEIPQVWKYENYCTVVDRAGEDSLLKKNGNLSEFSVSLEAGEYVSLFDSCPL